MTSKGGATAFVVNPGTSNETVVTQIATPLPQIRIAGNSELPEVIRQVNLFMEAVHLATTGSRSLPRSGPDSYLLGYSFTATKQVRLAHRLGTDRVRVWLGHKTAIGDISVDKVDTSFAWVTPNATFTADVWFLVSP